MVRTLKSLVNKIKILPLCTVLGIFTILVVVIFLWKTGKLNRALLEGLVSGQKKSWTNDEIEKLEAEKNLIICCKMETCGHCKRFLKSGGEWDKLKEKIEAREDLNFYRMVLYDSDLNASHIESNYPMVKGYPTIMIKNKGKDAIEYNGERNSDDIIEFLNGVKTN